MSARPQEREKRDEPPRIDVHEKVTGQATYTEDLPDLPGMLWGMTLSSPYSHARIVSIDSSKAERLPGVMGVLHRDCLEGLDPMLSIAKHPLWTLPVDQPFIATDKVRFDGEPVAMAVSEDRRTAMRAVELIDVKYEVLPPVFNAGEALEPGAPILHEARGTNLLLEDKIEWGDVEQGLREADQVFEEVYTSPSMFHHPMESVGVCVAQFLKDEVNLWIPTSSPYPVGQEVARFFDLDPDRVRVRVPCVGGHFGSKGLTGAMLAALFLSRKVGVKNDGTLTALDVHLVVDTGAYTTGGQVATRLAVDAAWGCYRIPHYRCSARCAYTNKVPATHTRGTGKVQTTWGVECAMDSIARKLGMDPFDFKLKNVRRRGVPPMKGAAPMDTNNEELMRSASAAIGWDGRSSVSGQVSPDRGSAGAARGRSIVLTLRQGSMGIGRAYVLATVNHRGIVKIQHSAPNEGQGVYNMIRIVAAQSLGLPVDQVQVAEPEHGHQLALWGHQRPANHHADGKSGGERLRQPQARSDRGGVRG